MGKPSARTARRAQGRTRAKLVRDLERLARLAPGGAPDRPIAITSPAQVEAKAQRQTCPLCEGSLRFDEHVAETIDGARLRVARLTCAACGTHRALYFTIDEPPLLQ